MGKQAFAVIIWVASIAIALFAGMQIGEKQVASTRTGHASRDESRPADYDVGERERSDPNESSPDSKRPESRSGSPSPDPTRDDVPTEEIEIDLETVETPEELSDLFMRYAKQKLYQGPAGQKTLFRKIDELIKDKKLRELVRDERQLMPLLYPWVRFGFENEAKVIEMMETLYRTAAEEPQWYQGLDDDPLEMFTEGLAIMLPGMVSEEQLAVFRGHAEAILKMDKESLPKALQRNYRDFQRNIEYWVGPQSPEEMLAQLDDPNVPDATKMQLLRRIPADQLRGYDVAGLVARQLETGNMSALSALRRLKLGGSDLVLLDRAFMAGFGDKNQWWAARQYLDSTGRSTWAQMKPFIEDGLRRGGQTMVNFARVLTYLRDKPSADYVQGMIASYDLPDDVVAQLKSAYQLK